MIKILDLHKSFANGKKKVLQGVNLTVSEGQTTSIIGGSGTGKSVLLKNILGLMKPDKGEIYVDNKEVTRMTDMELSEVRKKVGYVFQDAALFDSLSVEENVGFGLKNLTDLSDIDIEKRVRECLAMVGLKGIGTLRPSQLSGGMKKRVGLARAIAYKPTYLLYDEPTTGLDPIMADVINDLIISLQNKIGVTSIVVTHDMKAAYKVSNKISMLYDGKIIRSGTPDEIKQTDDPFVRQFIDGLSHGPIVLDLEETE
ncbi:ABC transporter ATP-binding protein [Elusimicrobiota bacterium]